MLVSPMMASDQLATEAGRPQRVARAGEMGDEEGDMKSAGEEPRMQEQIAAGGTRMAVAMGPGRSPVSS